MHSNRRSFLKAALAAGVLSPRALSALADGTAASGHALDRVAGFARLVGSSAHEDVLEAVVRAVDAGASIDELFAGVLLAGALDIEPRPVGFQLHALMMVGSNMELAAGAAEPLLPLLFNVDDLKFAQDTDRKQNDWSLGPALENTYEDAAAATRALRSGFEQWDAVETDRAVTAVSRALDIEDQFELMAPYMLRDLRNIGHKAIYGFHAFSALGRVGVAGFSAVQPLVRNLASALLEGGGMSARGPRSRAQLAPYERSLELLERLPEGWETGGESPAETGLLLGALREADASEAQDLVMGRLERRLAPRSIWDALRLYAYELQSMDPGLGEGIVAVHPVTSNHALARIALTSSSARTRALALLQAAAWLPLFRGEMQRRDSWDEDASPLIDEVEPVEAEAHAEGTELVARAMGERGAAAPAMLAALQAGHFPQLSSAFQARVYTKGIDSHPYKWLGAALTDTQLTHPRWAPYLLAAGSRYLPVGLGEDQVVHDRISAAIASARS